MGRYAFRMIHKIVVSPGVAQQQFSAPRIVGNIEGGRALPTGRMPLKYRLQLMVVAASTGLLAITPGFQTGGIIIADIQYV